MPDQKPVAETLETIAEKLTALSASTDKRFDEVSDAFVEPRRYPGFAVEQLRTEMKSGFGRLDRKLDRVLDTLTRTPPAPRRRS